MRIGLDLVTGVDYIQFGFIADDVEDQTITGNISEAVQSGSTGIDCNGKTASNPATFMLYPGRETGTCQPEFQETDIELALRSIADPAPGF